MTVFHAGQLGNESAMMQQLQSGALDMGWIQAAELGSRVRQSGGHQRAVSGALHTRGGQVRAATLPL